MPLRHYLSLTFSMLLAGLGGGLSGQAPAAKTTAITVDFGFVNASGNTSVTTLNFGNKFTANTADKKFVFTQTSSLVYGKTDGVKSAESYQAQLRGDYGLGSKFYLFGLTGWDRNTFGGIGRRFEETAGLGYKALADSNDLLSFEAGLSLFQQRNTTAPAGVSLDDNYKAGRLAGNYKHSFTKTSAFTESVEFLPNFDTSSAWRLNSESAFIAPISTNIALKLGYLFHYNNLPPFVSDTSTSRLKKSDRFLTMGITISY